MESMWRILHAAVGRKHERLVLHFRKNFMWGIFGGTAFVLIRKLVIPVVKLLGVRFKCSKKVIAEYDHEEKSSNEGDVDRESFFWWKRSAVLYMADQACV